MPSIIFDSTTRMPGIAFGIPTAAMSNGSQAGSSRSTSAPKRDECKECKQMNHKGHRHARDPKFCPKHQCPYKETHSGELCTQRKKGAEPRCPTHTRCKARKCPNTRSVDASGNFTEFCVDHTCIVENCDEGQAYNPKHGTHEHLCATHLPYMCKDPGCTRRMVRPGCFCEEHTCEAETCDQRNLVESGRPFCSKHNECGIPDCQNPRLPFGLDFEVVCSDHFIPPCQVDRCRKKSSQHTQFCNLHSCRYTDEERCDEEARPGLGKPFCHQHKCLDHDCQNLRSFIEVEGMLRMNSFCTQHECRKERCIKHSVPDKPFCDTHCCTNPGCSSSRDDDPRFGTLCYPHHEERAIHERLAAMRLQEEATARADQTARANAEARHHAQELAEELRERERRDRRQPAPDFPRRPEPQRPARSPPRHRYPGQEGLRPWPEREDEGYRSNRSSGGSFTTY